MINKHKIAVIIPCYKVKNQILNVIKQIGKEVDLIYCIDDKCPERSGKLLEKKCKDKKIRVIYHDFNQGVGGATITGIKSALKDGAQVIVKLDGDGQMDPAMIPRIADPIINGLADYTKGNRFHDFESIMDMPLIRLIGNSLLSFITKLSTGYWQIMDPTNGFIAIHYRVAAKLPYEKISNDYFFESDMLFRLKTIGAVVLDIPIKISYSDETSSLRPIRVFHYFAWRHLKNFFNRIIVTYLFQNFSIATVQLVSGIVFIFFGLIFGIVRWQASMQLNIATPAGTVMLAALPIIIGTQLLISFFNYDIKNIPDKPLHKNFQ